MITTFGWTVSIPSTMASKKNLESFVVTASLIRTVNLSSCKTKGLIRKLTP